MTRSGYTRMSFSKKKILWVGIVLCSVWLFVITYRSNDQRIQYRVVDVGRRCASPKSDANKDTSDAMACVLPSLEINDPAMMKSYEQMKPVDCQSHHKDLVYVDNGTLRFHQPLSPDTQCDLYPVVRSTDDSSVSFGDPVKNVGDHHPLFSEIFKIQCTRLQKIVYSNIHLGVPLNAGLKDRVRQKKLPADGLQLSVMMLGFDSMSRMSWLRRVPKTREYFVNTLGGIELEGYGIMGDGTPAALFPILTGKHEQQLPEARRGFSNAKPVDRFPWIWKDFKENGYITSWAEALTVIATFNYRLLGFSEPPTDFFTRPFYLAAEKIYSQFKHGCHGSYRYQEVWFKFIKDICMMYREEPKFLFHFYDVLSHDDNNRMTMGDADLKNLLQFLEEGGYLDNTLLILFADHGSRIAKSRTTLSGKLEERLPYFSLRFPKWFHVKHPDLIRNVMTNAGRLTTPMDVHEMLRDVLHFGSGNGVLNGSNEGISLFREIPPERTCAMANIAPHWCVCMSWRPVSTSDEMVRQAGQASVNFINGLTIKYRKYCAPLTVQNITSAYKSELTDSFLRFKETKGDRGLEPVLSRDKVEAERHLFQLTFITAPSGGAYEITLTHDLANNEFIVEPSGISRINLYGHAADCVAHLNREIRQYCYCQQEP